MRKQLVTRRYEDRKRMFDRVQELLMENLPLIPLVSPHILTGARGSWPISAPPSWIITRFGTSKRCTGRVPHPEIVNEPPPGQGREQRTPGGGVPSRQRTGLEHAGGSL